MRLALLVNRRRSSRRTDKVDEKSRALRLMAATHRGLTSGKHLFRARTLPETCTDLHMLTSAQDSSIRHVWAS